MADLPESVEPAAPAPHPERHHGEDDEISLLDLLIVLAKHKKMILRFTGSIAAIALVAVFLMPKIYTGTAVMMPPQEDKSAASAMLGQLIGLGGTSGGSGIASALGLRNPNDLYVGILKSRTIADRLIERFKLQDLYRESTLVDTRKELDGNTTITAGKDGLITIEVDDEDPKRAADMANAYVEELDNLTRNLAVTDASRRRIYYQKQVDETKEALRKADLALKAVQEKTGLIKPDDQASAIFYTMASLRGQIAAKEVELSAMSSFATGKNPDYIRVQQELAGMREQLAGFERNNKLGGGDILVPTGKIPEAGLEFLTKWRDVKYYETVYQLLAKQLELARVEEGKNAILIQLVDKALPLDKKSKPKRALIVILSTLAAGVLAVLWALLADGYERARIDPFQAERLRRLRDNLRRR